MTAVVKFLRTRVNFEYSFWSKLVLENKKVEPKNFTKQIAFNIIPHIDVFSDDGYTKEELKMVNETKKILDSKIDLTATCVRLPVLVSHSESVNIEFEKWSQTQFEVRFKKLIWNSKFYGFIRDCKLAGQVKVLKVS